MLNASLVFIVATLLLLTGSRLALSYWQRDRIRVGGGLKPIILGGWRIDAHQIGIVVAAPLVLAPWFGHMPLACAITLAWYWFAWMLFVLMEVSTPPFITEYDARPNRLFIEYLKHPKEVMGMLWRGYKSALIGGTSLFLILGVALPFFVMAPAPDAPMVWWLRPIVSLIALAIVILAIRGTLAHRPINASVVAFSGDAMLNTLPLNSLYSVVAAMWSMRKELSSSAFYGKIPLAEQTDTVRAAAGFSGPPLDEQHPTMHHQVATHKRERPLNIVIIVEESLGAQYSQLLGGENLTPALDALAQEAWTFTKTYATGTRSIRGLEALVTGFPPTPARAVIKLPRAQRGFFSLADLLGRHGYSSRFVYGGESHFDNMKAFFLGNGFNRIVDRADFTKPEFVGTWGVSDEDMFNKVDELLSSDGDEPTFTVAFTVSNHTPYEFPAGRIPIDGEAATAANSVRYADWALGDFFRKAKQSSYWDKTVFLVVADHDSRVFGPCLIPVRHFHIPALILGADIAPRMDDRIISQIDLPPTLLSLAGVSALHPMIGRDLTCETPHRAMMQYGDNYGYLKNDVLMVLTPQNHATQYTYTAPETFVETPVDSKLMREALAHVSWPSWAYREGRYTLTEKQQA